jgi:hypothetical protein
MRQGLAEIVTVLPGLNKIIADGLTCDRLENLRALCSAIVKNPNVMTCNLLKADLWQLGISMAGCSTEGTGTQDELRKKARASTIEQKVEFTREYFRKEGDFLHITKDIYLRILEITARAVMDDQLAGADGYWESEQNSEICLEELLQMDLKSRNKCWRFLTFCYSLCMPSRAAAGLGSAGRPFEDCQGKKRSDWRRCVRFF